MFEIKVDDSGAIALMKKLQDRISDLTPVMRNTGELIKTSVKRNFEVGGRYSEEGSWRGGTQPWQPLSIATLFAGKAGRYVAKSGKYRKGVEERFKNRHILIKRGRLMKSVNYQASKSGVRVGSNVVYAAIHQFGGQAGRGRKVSIPARPYLVIQDTDMQRIKDNLNKYLAGDPG